MIPWGWAPYLLLIGDDPPKRGGIVTISASEV